MSAKPEGGEIVWEFTLNFKNLKMSIDCLQKREWRISAPSNQGFVLEFNKLQMFYDDIVSVFEITMLQQDNLIRKLSRKDTSLAPLLMHSNKVKIVVQTLLSRYNRRCFNISYTLHPLASMPLLWEEGVYNRETESLYMYNCTGISNLPSAIRCDGIRHCEYGEDEKSCPYRHQGCGDWFPYGDFCLKATFLLKNFHKIGYTQITMPIQAEEACETRHGATLAVLDDEAGIKTVKNMVQKSGYTTVAIGLRKVKPQIRELRHLYRFLWQWGRPGSPIAYEQIEIQREGTMADCAKFNISHTNLIQSLSCSISPGYPEGFICMKAKENYHPEFVQLSGVSLPQPLAVVDQFPTKTCPDGSLVQTFHRCHWGEEEVHEQHSDSWSANGFSLFLCRYGPTVHYSLVCDGKGDCIGSNDELGCHQPKASPLVNTTFVCRNLQVIRKSQRCVFPCQTGDVVPEASMVTETRGLQESRPGRCDSFMDCFDETDEEFCVTCASNTVMCPTRGCVHKSHATFIPDCPQWVERMDDLTYYPNGSVILDGHGMSTTKDGCHDGFFHCQGGLCIPSFLLNNKERDCPQGEDENIPLDNTTCPGYYRCYKTGNCVHHDSVCDGVYHCPYKDDEMYCDLVCPQHCVCEGLAIRCSTMIDPLQNLHLRYLDLSHATNVSLDIVHLMEFLLFLNLSSCSLTHASLHDMPQLKTLDLSHNTLTNFISLTLSALPSLTHLNLSYNPLVTVLDSAFTAVLNMGQLHRMEALVMTNIGLQAIDSDVFSPLSQLKMLDISSNPAHTIEYRSLNGLPRLEVLYTDNSKLCCDYFHSTVAECHAPVDELSSCDDLLSHNFFRLFLWFLSVLTLFGNVGVLAYRFCSKKQSVFTILVTNLCMSDLMMGVYMLMIGVADATNRGQYVAKEREWTHSITCTVAGFLSFVSSEMSAMVICLITLDRVLVICFSFKKNLHPGRFAITWVCSGMWVVSASLAAVPLLTEMQFYGLNGICIPLPITRQQFSGQTYAFSIFICFNFALFLFIGTGQLVIYWSVLKAGASAGQQRSEQALARRLFLVVATDFLCWFPIGLLGLLIQGGVPVPAVVNVWAAIFVLPLNSALNPFLYTLNGVLQQWRRRHMEEFSRRTLGKLQVEIPQWSSSSVETLIKICVHSKAVDHDKLLRCIGVEPTSANKSEEVVDLA